MFSGTPFIREDGENTSGSQTVLGLKCMWGFYHVWQSDSEHCITFSQRGKYNNDNYLCKIKPEINDREHRADGHSYDLVINLECIRNCAE